MPQLRIHPRLLRPLMPVSILVLYDRKNSAIEDLARAAATGVEISGATVSLKRITEAFRADLLASGLAFGFS